MSKKIFIDPQAAVEFIGTKEQEVTRSLASPKPIVKTGDILIVTPVDAYNLVQLFPTLWKRLDVKVLEIQSDEDLENQVIELDERIVELESENAELALASAYTDSEETVVLRTRESFTRKEDLETYAKETFDIVLDIDTLDNMYAALVEAKKDI